MKKPRKVTVELLEADGDVWETLVYGEGDLATIAIRTCKEIYGEERVRVTVEE